jgi:uncharacterized protein YndB with AHSA1/START domain
MKVDIRHHFFYNHPLKDVWEFLTNRDLITQWLMPNDFQPVVGCSFQLKAKAMPQFNTDGIFHCRVLEIVPFKKLVYSLKTGPGDGIFNMDTMVTWTLSEKNNGTEVELVHGGFDEVINQGIFNGMNGGWLKQMELMDKQLNNLHIGNSNT